MVGRIPVMDVMPLVDLGRLPGQGDGRRALPGHARRCSARATTSSAPRWCSSAPDGTRRPPVRMTPDGDEPDRYDAWVTPDAEGAWTFEVQAWSDPLATWQHDAGLKIPAGVDVELMFTEGAAAARAGRRPTADLDAAPRREVVAEGARRPPRDTARPVEARLAALQSPELVARPGRATRCASWSPSRAPTRCTPTGRARSSAAGTSSSRAPRARRTTRRPARSSAAPSAPPPSASTPWPRWASTSSTCRRSTRSARSTARGRNNTLDPGPDDPGSPWAIGSKDGGHDAIHPDLGTLEDFDAFVDARQRARASRSPSTWPCSARPTTRG